MNQQQLEMARQLREQSEARINDSAIVPTGAPAAQRTEIHIPTSYGEARANVYRPLEAGEHVPVFINLHGGGFVLGAPEDDDPWCAFIAEHAGCVVVNIDYVLAPEFKFPKPVYQCYEIAEWIHTHADQLQVDGSKLAIGGHSAGGNLSAAVCLLNRERGDKLPLLYQILDYPPLDLAADPADKPMFDEAIPVDVARMFNTMYFESLDDARNPLASPVLAPISRLEGLPPALVITAGKDSLAAEAEVYADMLKQANVSVLYRTYPLEAHGFTHSGTRADAEEAWRLMAEQLKQAFEQSSI